MASRLGGIQVGHAWPSYPNVGSSAGNAKPAAGTSPSSSPRCEALLTLRPPKCRLPRREVRRRQLQPAQGPAGHLATHRHRQVRSPHPFGRRVRTRTRCPRLTEELHSAGTRNWPQLVRDRARRSTYSGRPLSARNRSPAKPTTTRSNASRTPAARPTRGPAQPARRSSLTTGLGRQYRNKRKVMPLTARAGAIGLKPGAITAATSSNRRSDRPSRV